MSTRIFEVHLDHVRYGRNWSKINVTARTAREAINKAERLEKEVRAMDVKLIAEAD